MSHALPLAHPYPARRRLRLHHLHTPLCLATLSLLLCTPLLYALRQGWIKHRKTQLEHTLILHGVELFPSKGDHWIRTPWKSAHPHSSDNTVPTSPTMFKDTQGVITSANLKILLQFPSLEYLQLTGPLNPDELTIVLSQLPALRVLILKNSHATDQHLHHIATLHTLSHIALYEAECTHLGLESLQQLPHLRCLLLEAPTLQPTDLTPLQNCPHLEDLQITGDWFTDPHTHHLARALKNSNLKHLDLSTTSITNKSLPAIARIQKLESLNLTQTQITKIATHPLNQLPHLHTLQTNDPPPAQQQN